MGKQVKTPRFYVDMVTFLHATGQLGWDDANGGAELLYMNCANPYLYESEETENQVTPFKIGDSTNNIAKTSFPVNFVALLNHNLHHPQGFRVIGKSNYPFETDAQTEAPRFVPSETGSVLNSNFSGQLISPQYNGTTLYTFESQDAYWRQFSIYYGTPEEQALEAGKHQLGSLVVGKYFDCPNSPDLNLTMSRRFDGIKRQKTVGGKTLANIYYDGPTEWTMNGPNGTYKYPPFELDLATVASTTDDVNTDDINEQINDFNQISKSGIGRKGLRSWNLTFSYIAESDMWIDNEVSNTLTSDDVTPNNNTPNPMLSDNSFNFVWNCTLGGTLPFIFTDDKDSNEPDRYAICNFRENSFKVNQVAFNTYSVSMTIDEIA